ncbi:hypothetical protein FQN57_002787 [Myotisia sp. PD_48]|nr:hypothetical protein FQN57_002787 [Myotisia sp. PD_48]
MENDTNNNNTPLRRKDTTKGPPLRILSLDGGGVRGYSMLIILQELMYRTYVECEGKAPRRDQIPKPCDHFDLIAGTGTGGLIALMLGRLRMDIETCKDVYIRMTRRVFETDKTFAGIPYRSTLFKASKLEEAIRQCVREHTVSEAEGNDGTLPPFSERFPPSPAVTSPSTATLGIGRRLSRASVSTMGTATPTSPTRPSPSYRSMWGNSNAKLYDNRENRTKTAVAAVYKGTPKNGSAIFLRSYDSRKEPPPEFNCTIWQAGRATCATGLAFKPIQIGQHMFIDEGAGKYNMSPQILDEAAVNEWPGREVGVFVTIGTGKRPPGTNNRQHEWWEDVFADSLGTYAEARRRLIAKIEACETIHQYMLKDHLAKRNVPKENYFRLNVEVGVGEFGMNEWNRLADISTNTRMYLGRSEVQKMNFEAAVRLAKIQRMHRRIEAHASAMASASGDIDDNQNRPLPPIPKPPPEAFSPSPFPQGPIYELPAIELPTNTPPMTSSHQSTRPSTSQGNTAGGQFSLTDDKFTIIASDELPEAVLQPRRESSPHGPGASPARQSLDQPSHSSPRPSLDGYRGRYPPPVPPKTPIPYPDDNAGDGRVGGGGRGGPSHVLAMPIPPKSPDRPIITSHKPTRYKLPYPDDEPPPPVNRNRKPTYNAR